MRLPNGVYEAVGKKKIRVFKADRGTVRFWNNERSPGDLRFYTGWYWYAENEHGRVVETEHGPFHSKAAAFKNAFENQSLKLEAPKVRPIASGQGIIKLPVGPRSKKKPAVPKWRRHAA